MVKKATDSKVDSVEVISLDAIEGSKDVVRINGKSYDLRGLDSLGLAPRSRIRRLVTRIEALEALEEITDADETEYRARLLEVASFAIPSAPQPAIDKLGTGQLADLATAFFVRAAMKSPRLAMVAKLSSPTSSPTRSGSTAATR